MFSNLFFDWFIANNKKKKNKIKNIYKKWWFYYFNYITQYTKCVYNLKLN